MCGDRGRHPRPSARLPVFTIVICTPMTGARRAPRDLVRPADERPPARPPYHPSPSRVGRASATTCATLPHTSHYPTPAGYLLFLIIILHSPVLHST
ncbi:hypothetical protein RR46_05354 [Papilio xuthus]|uniref:Uncharacterized protein n=1 Tax=Papilio xuthus TaxID=66420 RepID=A0A194Q6T7_PAPXU|nr:hypothetical protein RR46_05354 [Papilio xuthus]